jgi:hypothetical protein
VQERASSALRSLSDFAVNDPKIAAAGIPRLIALLASRSVVVQEHAAAVLFNISFFHDANIAKIVI